MASSILTDWDAEKASAFTKQNVIAHHSMHERDMFSDDGLIDLLDRYPRDLIGIYTMGDDPLKRQALRAGSAEGVSGKDLLEAVRHGHIWLNLRKVNHELPEYEALCEELFGAVEAGTPGAKTWKHDFGVLISSPNVQVYYHFDVPLVMLCQIRGVKRVWLYQPKVPFLTDDNVETVVLKETEEEIPFDLAYDKDAQIVDLEPGMLATWPQFGPHRIVNHDMMNVSLSCEFQTYMSLLQANAAYANGVFRRNFGMNPTIYQNSAAALHAKAGFARIFKILKLRKAFEYQIPKTFKVDPNADRGFVEA